MMESTELLLPKDAMDHGFALITEKESQWSVPEGRYYIQYYHCEYEAL